MKVITHKKYREIFKNMKIDIESKKFLIDIFHKNNWDHLIMHWDEIISNECVSYIDFFFDAKTMVDFLRKWLKSQNFTLCYISCVNNTKYKLIKINEDIHLDIYDEFKKMINTLGLKVNTNKAIVMTKDEFIDWCDRFSIGGFLGISEFSVLIPELELLMQPYHHMNYLFYCKQKKTLDFDINCFPEIGKI